MHCTFADLGSNKVSSSSSSSSSQACKDFGLAISLKKTNVLGQDT